MRIRYAKLLLCLGLLAGAQANAESFLDPRILGGVSVGKLDLEDKDFASPTGLQGFDATTTSWSLFVGFELNRYLSFEVGRLDGGNASQETQIAGAPPSPPPFNRYDITRVESSAWYGSVLGSLPLSDEVSVFGRGGLLSWKTKTQVRQQTDTLDLAGALVSTANQYWSGSDDGTSPHFGLGIAINIDSGVLRLEYALSKFDDIDVRLISLTAAWKFKFW